MFWLLIFLIYWLVLFVACYIVVEYGQTYYYDEKTSGAALRVAGGTLILAVLWARRSALQLGSATRVETWFDRIFTTEAAWLLLVSIVAFVIFTLLLQFHPRHAVFLGPATVLIVGYMASLAADNLAQPTTARAQVRLPSKPQRKGIGGLPPAISKDATAPVPRE